MEGPSSHVQAQRAEQDSKGVGHSLSSSTGDQSPEGARQGSQEGGAHCTGGPFPSQMQFCI